MRRTLVLLAVAGAVLGPAAPAYAHGGDAPDSSPYLVSVVSAPPGVTVRAVEAGARLELTNPGVRSVEVLGYSGEPYLDVRPDGTWQNVNSPATYVNQTVEFDSPVPASADPSLPPAWQKLSGSTTVRWHDRRASWQGADATWTIPLRDQATVTEVRGTITAQSPPAAWLWWAAAVALAFAVASPAAAGWRGAAGLRTTPLSYVGFIGHLLIGAAAIYLGYAVLRALDVREFAPVPVVVALVAAGFGAFGRRSGFGLALGGAVLAVFGGLADTGVYADAVVPVIGPSWFARLAVTLAIGAGAGAALAGVARMRAERPAATDRVAP